MMKNYKYEYRAATISDLEAIWAKDITDNLGDDRWVRWRTEYINYNRSGMAKTFVVVCNDIPVGQGTLLFSPECKAVSGRTQLADGHSTANINALRIEKDHEGKGHISAMVRLMEKYAADNGYTTLTIGVERDESRNRAIYGHWGYCDLLFECDEDGDDVLYYAKRCEKNDR